MENVRGARVLLTEAARWAEVSSTALQRGRWSCQKIVKGEGRVAPQITWLLSESRASMPVVSWLCAWLPELSLNARGPGDADHLLLAVLVGFGCSSTRESSAS